jgi:uncharacterized protein (TIGR02147 family)
MISIYDYQDYRRYLKDILQEVKKERKTLSQRAILQKIGISSSGFIANVMAGRSNLTVSQVQKLSKVIKLSKAETSYFEMLLNFNHAKTIEEKTEFFERLSEHRRSKLKVLSAEQLSLFSKWYYAVIRECAYFIDVTDSQMLAEYIAPAITQSEAIEGVETLLKLGFLKKEPDGTIVQSDPLVSSGDEVRSFDIIQFQSATLDKARRALLEIPADQRDISVLTITASEDCVAKIKDEVKQFRKKILRIVQEDPKPDRVLQCSINIFPVTGKAKETR